MSNLMDFIGGNSSKIENNLTTSMFNFLELSEGSELISTSKTIIVQKTGRYIVFLSGGGGSGAAVGNADNCCGTGGGCGDLAVKNLLLTQDESINVTIGAGGAGVDGNGSNAVVTNGNNGGTSSFGSYFSTQSVSNGGVGVTDGSYIEVNAPSLSFLPDGVDSSGAKKVYTSKELQMMFDGSRVINSDNIVNGANYSSASSRIQGGGGKSMLVNGGDAGAQTPPSSILGAGSGCREYYSSANGGDGFALMIYVGEK